MICKYCGQEMDFDFTDGMGYTECHVYACLCGASVIVNENGEEDIWER